MQQGLLDRPRIGATPRQDTVRGANSENPRDQRSIHAGRNGRHLNSERNSEQLDRGQTIQPTYEHRKLLHNRWERRIPFHASA